MIRRQFTATLIGLTGLMHAPIASAQVADIADAINKAGRQRMLSQRMAKSWIAIGMGIEATRAQKTLADSMALFDRQFVELKAFAPNADIRATYAAIEPLWADYKTALVGSAPSKAATPALITLDGKILALANQGTLQLEKQSGKAVGRLVNIAGRQRMLSQRMAKFYLARAWNAGVASAGADLDKAKDEFIAALKLLEDAPEATSAIKQELQLARQQWVFFDNALANAAEGGNQRSTNVFTASENLLEVMDRVTGMYARLGA
jgi:nitrate/nitrite-specific signal transduction histidine kinase